MAVEALKGELSSVELASKFEVHPTQIAKWKKLLLESGSEIFGSARERREKDDEAEKDRLLKKIDQRKDILEPEHAELSMRSTPISAYQPWTKRSRLALPETFNSDQGCQYTSEAFTGRLLQAGVAISMDGKGRVFVKTAGDASNIIITYPTFN